MRAEPKVRRWSRIRLWFLLALLFCTLVGAWHELASRRARTRWQRPLEVAVALVELGPVDAEALSALHDRFPALAARLGAEYHRHGGSLSQPVRFHVFGPVSVDHAPPAAPDESPTDLARYAYELWRWTRAVDQGSALPAGSFDSRIYLVVHAPRDARRSWVEGLSELGGRVGVARIELEASSVDLALFVVTHELFHTLGASDKYDETSGLALLPAGLVEPERSPLFPQRYAEVMTRNLVLGAGSERPPESLAELGVGSQTAREIGWASSKPPK